MKVIKFTKSWEGSGLLHTTPIAVHQVEAGRRMGTEFFRKALGARVH